MEPKDHKRHSETRCIKAKVLPLERRVTKQARDISQEPEMKELDRMLDAGDLDFERTLQYLKGKDNAEEEG